MTAIAVVAGRIRPAARWLTGLHVFSLAEYLRRRPDADAGLLVVGDTADLAAVAATTAAPIAFAGAGDIAAMFALDPSLPAARQRLESGVAYPADLGWCRLGASERPFLGGVAAGGAAHRGSGFPWRAPSGEVAIRGEARSERIVAGARGVFVLNGQRLSGRVVSPRAAMGDGRLDLLVLAGTPLHLWSLRRAIIRGLHLAAPGVHRISRTGAEISVPDSWPVRCDGRVLGRGRFEVRVDPGVVMLLV